MSYAPPYTPPWIHPSRTPEAATSMAGTYDLIMDNMVLVNKTHPQMEYWLKDNEWINDTVKRVIQLHENGEDPKARPRIITSKLWPDADVLRFVCAVVRGDGSYENHDGTPMLLKEEKS